MTQRVLRSGFGHGTGRIGGTDRARESALYLGIQHLTVAELLAIADKNRLPAGPVAVGRCLGEAEALIPTQLHADADLEMCEETVVHFET